MAEWVSVAQETDVREVLRVDIGGQPVALFRVDGQVFALHDICSHEYARLSDGELWDDRVYCPKHGSAFDVKTGAVEGLPATAPVKSFPVRVEAGRVYVRVEG
jgi:nitrite reductase/ring-hydroxylating ferredoxin subunit